jgi:nitrate reductase gamma subunit
VLPYIALTAFVVGHIWRHRRDGFRWTARSTQLLERRLLLVGSVLFHVGILGAIAGHVLGILIPESWTEAVGISEDAYHWIAVVAGGAAGIVLCIGALVLVYRRLRIDRIRATTLQSDWVMYPLLLTTIVLGMLCTFMGGLADAYNYRETVSPWFRSVFTLQPKGSLMTGAPFVYQAHVTIAWVLFAVWPFTRLVHVWSVPLGYVVRSPIVYRAKRAGGPTWRRPSFPARAGSTQARSRER